MNTRYMSHDELEGCFLGGGIWPGIKGELGKGQQMAPVILMEVCKDTGALFELLVGMF
jgi:hypothetical protein